MTKSLLRVLAAAICLLVSANVSYAGSITFGFTCSILIPGTTPDSCGAPTGDYGSITLTDNANGGVTISWNLKPAFGTTLERILLNTVNPNLEASTDIFMVAAGGGAVKTPTTGTALYSNNGQGLGDFGFDIRLSPNDNDFIGSELLTLWTEGASGVLVPITTAFFTATTPGDPSHPGTPNLYAGYRTVNITTQGEFWAGSTGAVPEPASLMLLGTGLIGLAARARGVRRRKQILSFSSSRL